MIAISAHVAAMTAWLAAAPLAAASGPPGADGAASATRAGDTPRCDVLLERTDGSLAPLLPDAGKPAVVFYEDRRSTSVNDALKDALYAHGRARGLLHEVRIVAVANIREYDFFPARDFALAFIRGAESAAGVPILVDVRGTLASPPWSLPGDGSTVALLDRQCREAFRHTGALGAAETSQFFTALEAAVAERRR